MKLASILHAITLFAACPALAFAHALPERYVPARGASLAQAPEAVTVYFDAQLEPVFSKLVVKDEQGKKVSRGAGVVTSGDHKAIQAGLATKQKGVFRVYWDVVSHDGHRASGDYSFTVK
jgi:methionine-rich copper-binding protein CopC